jgi:hypothetical protein
MAEVAAGVYVAAEAIEHTAEAAYAGYIVSKPTLPLKVTFTRIATASGDQSAYVNFRPLRRPELTCETLAGTFQPHSHRAC